MAYKLNRLIAYALALGLVLLAALTGSGFLLAALYIWLEDEMPAWGAALSVGGACFALAFLVLLILRTRSPSRGGGAAAGVPPSGSGSPTSDLAFDLGRVGAERVRHNPKTSVASALLAGLLFGLSPGLRRRLLDMLNDARR